MHLLHPPPLATALQMVLKMFLILSERLKDMTFTLLIRKSINTFIYVISYIDKFLLRKIIYLNM